MIYAFKKLEESMNMKRREMENFQKTQTELLKINILI